MHACRVALPADLGINSVTMEAALQLLALPKELGSHAGDGEPVFLKQGR